MKGAEHESEGVGGLMLVLGMRAFCCPWGDCENFHLPGVQLIRWPMQLHLVF